jgi:serine/threonine-protein kinase HipA
LEALAAKSFNDRPPLLKGLGAKLSIAGAQDKIPLYTKNDRFYLPEDGSNSLTTIILKIQSSNYKFLVENEYFCLNLADLIGLPVTKSKIITIENTNILILERYDRAKTEDDTIIRLHQEYFCQALNISPQRKYEEQNGPNFKDCTDLILNSQLNNKYLDLENFIKVSIFNYIIGNCDAHG